jgi:hypothetical protein
VFVQLLVEFLFRLTFGVATAMALTPARWVTSGFFRVHLWVLLGVQTLAALATSRLIALVASDEARDSIVLLTYRGRFWLAVAAAVVSYLGAVIWMYERRLAGKAAIAAVAMLAFAGLCLPVVAIGPKPVVLQLADRVTSGLLLGLVTTAMLLGHWYLNTPTMKLEPLKRLIVMLGVSVVLRVIVCFPGAWLVGTAYLPSLGMPPSSWFLFVALRWFSGLAGVLVLALLTWQTLKIPNTQSATGILYAGVVLAFIGELTSQLLSAQALYPV